MNPRNNPTPDQIIGQEGQECTEIERDIRRTGVALSTSETVGRFGGANAEYIKGYRGIDNETGQEFAKGLAGIAKNKVHPDYAKSNIKQQAGYSAEVATTSRDNAEAIIARSDVRTVRSDDRQEYGKNHNVVDRVQVFDGQVIEGSQSQMKFVGDRDELLRKIAKENGEFSRYRGTKLELPSEQYEGAAQHCQKQAQELRVKAERVEQAGKPKIAAKFRREADNYEQLAGNVRDSGLTTKQAIFYREHPTIATALDIAHTSHRAGMEGAKFGTIIGGAISLLQHCFTAAQDKKKTDYAANDTTRETVKTSLLEGLIQDTAKAGALGYGTAFAGSALKGTMQQSGRQYVRTLANTSAPSLAVNICLSLSSSIKRYVTGEISEAKLLEEVGEKGTGMLSSSMMAALGQLAIPVPFVGAAIGGMIGYTMSSLFYQSALDAARGAEASRNLLERTRAIESAARARLTEEQAALDDFFTREIPALRQEMQCLFTAVDASVGQADALAEAINEYATLLGKRLLFQSMAEFNDFMQSDQTLQL